MSFFAIAKSPSAADIAAWVGGEIVAGDPERTISSVAPLDAAGPNDLSFIDNKRYLPQFEGTRAGVCLAAPTHAARAPKDTTVVGCEQPYNALGIVLLHLYPQAARATSFHDAADIAPTIHPTAAVHPDARLESDVQVDPGASIGARTEIGSGSVIGANVVIGPGVTIGRDCVIGPGSTIECSHIGDRVIVHCGVRIGQDGFGFAMGPTGHRKIPQIGRVIIQNDVEIGANTTVDRGALRDTVIGEGTKIDNLVQVAHNVQIGRHCIIVAQTGISGSSTLGDFVALGGQVGVVGHLSIGDGAQIAATSNVKDDVPAGAVWGGTPAKPIRQWFREVTALRKLAENPPKGQ